MQARDGSNSSDSTLKDRVGVSLRSPRIRLQVRRVGETPGLRPRMVSEKDRAMQSRQSRPSLPNQSLEPTTPAVRFSRGTGDDPAPFLFCGVVAHLCRSAILRERFGGASE